MSTVTDSKSGSTSYSVDKLTETNYRSWASQLHWILDEKEAWDIVKGTEIAPIRPTGTTESPATAEAIAEYEQKALDFTKRSKKAKSTIGASITSPIMVYIEGLDDPVEMWKTLEDKYNPKTQTTLFQTIREFFNVQMLDGGDMEKHLQRVQLLKRQCEEQGEPISKNVYNAVLLNSVPDDYRITVSILEGQDQLDPMTVINRLMEEWRKLSGDTGGGAKMVTALLTNHTAKSSPKFKFSQKATSPAKPSTSSTSSNLYCIHCKRKGHDQSTCWKKHPALRPIRYDTNKTPISMMAVTKFHHSAKSSASCWYLDSGSSDHFSPYQHLFHNLQTLPEPVKITTSHGTAYGVATGQIHLQVLANGQHIDTILNNVIFAPDMHCNLLSTTVLYNKGYEISMRPGIGVHILRDGNIIAEAIRQGNLFRLLTVEPSFGVATRSMLAATCPDEDITVWHRRFAHMGAADVRKMETLGEGMEIHGERNLGVCGSCMVGKQTRTPSHEPSLRAKKPGDLIHSDTSGEIRPTAIDGSKYYGLFIDDATRATYIALMKTNGSAEMLKHLKLFASALERDLGAKIKRIRTDGGSEYKLHVDQYLKEQGIQHEITPPYHPDQNGVAERANRTIMGRVRAIIHDAKFPKELWGEVAQTVVYLKNRSPTAALDNTTPFEAWYGRKPALDHLRILGCTAYVHVPAEKRIKIDDRAEIGQLIGYGGANNQWKVWIPERETVVSSRDVKFDEKRSVAELPAPEPVIYDTIQVTQGPPDNYPTPPTTIQDSPPPPPPMSPEAPHGFMGSPDGSESEHEQQPQQPPQAPQRPQPTPARTSTRPGKGQHSARYGYTANLATTIGADDEPEPTSFDEAINHPTRAKEWEDEIMKEYNAIMKNGVWVLVPRPKNRPVVSSKWVWKHKRDQFHIITRLKARLVARGFSQTFGVDYFDTYAPVAKLMSIRILLAIAAAMDLELHQMDVVTAFLANKLEEEIYMEQPEGFVFGEDMVCKLVKSIYGLKQSPRLWNKRLDEHLRKLDFEQTESDHCVYINKNTGIILAMWVDDILIFGADKMSVDLLKLQLSIKFEMKDMGELSYFLGIQVHRDRKNRKLWIHQEGYTKAILERFGMENSAPVSTPFAKGTKLFKSTDNDDNSAVDQKLYQSNIGSQMYAMLCTRPDLAYTISQISQYSTNPSSIHETAAKRCLRYLNGTRDLGICYDGSNGLILEGYSDADWGAGEDRRSISGFLFLLCGGAVTYSAKKQTSTALSTTEAEYAALVQAAKESIWIQRLLQELRVLVANANVLYGDNQGSIALANNPEYHARTKHIDIQYHFIRECVQSGKIDLQYCPTNDMLADGMTKPMARDRHEDLLKRMGMERITQVIMASPKDQPTTDTGNSVDSDDISEDWEDLGDSDGE